MLLASNLTPILPRSGLSGHWTWCHVQHTHIAGFVQDFKHFFSLPVFLHRIDSVFDRLNSFLCHLSSHFPSSGVQVRACWLFWCFHNPPNSDMDRTTGSSKCILSDHLTHLSYFSIKSSWHSSSRYLPCPLPPTPPEPTTTHIPPKRGYGEADTETVSVGQAVRTAQLLGMQCIITDLSRHSQHRTISPSLPVHHASCYLRQT